jgi:hypothetical protein
MTPTAMTTAVTMTHRSSAIPTAVITESRLKTMSSSMIWTITLAKLVTLAPAPVGCSSPSSLP